MERIQLLSVDLVLIGVRPVMAQPQELGRLTLTRKEGQRISIGDDIEVEVVKIKDERVVFAVFAPKDIAILRTEKKPKDA